jgi:ATP-dependent RNA helicase DeaD
MSTSDEAFQDDETVAAAPAAPAGDPPGTPEPPAPLSGFAALGLSPAVLEALARKGFEEPTRIQAEVIPLLLGGATDIVAQSHTGTGKTAAFGLPLLELLQPVKGPVQALVLVPTRELAIQVSEELNSLRPRGAKGGDLHIVPVYGGQSYELQFRHFRQGVDIVVGTPGRIIDHLQRGSLKLDQVQYVVLDEADEMLDMGFIDDIEAILGMCTTRRSMLLFSATMPGRIRDVASTWMRDIKHVSVKSSQLTTSLTEQLYFEVMERDKFEALGRIIDIEPDFYGLVFCRTKVESDNVANRLIERGYDADTLHGDVSQAMREKVLDKFRRKLITVLVATDVAARGIDVDCLTHVINYSLPTDAESYVHRIGRTGRAGREGTAITFVSPEEFRKLRYIQQASRSEIRREKVPSIEEVLARKRQRIFAQLAGLTGPSMPDGSEGGPEAVPEAFLELADELLNQADAKGTETRDLIAALLHHGLRDELDAGRYRKITEIEPGGRKRRDDFGQRGAEREFNRDREDYGPPRERSIPEGSVRLYVARGKADGFTKPRLVEFIRKNAKVRDRDIDGVEVYEFYSFISVPLAEAERILHAFQSGEAERGKDGKPIVRPADAAGSGGGKFRDRGPGGHHGGHYGKKPYGKFRDRRDRE